MSLWSGVVARIVQYSSHVTGGSLSLLLVSGVTSVLGLGVGSVVYAWYRGFDLAVRAPQRGSWLPIVVLVAAPLLVLALVSAIGNIVAGLPLSTITHRWISPEISPVIFLTQIVLPAVFLGLGYGMLVCGVVVESIRAVVADEDVTWVSALVIGLFWLLPINAVASLPFTLGSAYELLVTLVFGIAYGLALGSLYRVFKTEDPPTHLARRHLAVFFLAGIGVIGIVTGILSISELIESALWVIMLTLSVVGYQRARSTWVAVLIITAFTHGLRIIIYIEAVLGVATP